MFLKGPDEHQSAHRFKRWIGRLAWSVFGVLIAGVASGSEVFLASLEPDSKASVSVLWRQSELDPVVRTSGVNAITVPLSGGGSSTVFSNTDAEIELSQESSEVVAAFSFRPSESLHYKVKFGAIRDFDLEFSSGSATNSLESFDDGFRWGLGVGGVSTPGSIVSAGISWELSYSQAIVGLKRFESASGVTPVDHRFEQDEFQGTIGISRRWGSWEPYGGLKIFRVVSTLKDKATRQKISGGTEGVSPFAGLQAWISEKDFFRLEGSFVDEESLHASLGLSF